MKKMILGLVMIAATTAKADDAKPKILPELNVIKTATLMGDYNEKGSTMFLSSDALDSDAPELFIYTWESGVPEVNSDYRGGHSVFADMGEIPLEGINEYTAQSPEWQLGKSYDFRIQADLKVGHTYSVLLNTHSARGIMLFKVESINPTSKTIIINYAVREYEVLYVYDRASIGFNRDGGNLRKGDDQPKVQQKLF